MVSEQKLGLVRQLTDTVQKHAIVGVVNLENLPAQQLQQMRSLLKKQGVALMTARKRLLQRALQQSKKAGIEHLTEKLEGVPALIFSNSNPFGLYAAIQKNKSEAPAKAGQKAPRDIVVKAGATNFAPGPIISELAAVGIKTKVEAGKLAITNDVTVAKEGTVISQKLAETLKRLDIKPMEIGLHVVAVWENGLVFTGKQLHIDEAEYVRNVQEAVQWALNLAVEAAYVTTDTSELLLQKAFREAKAVAVESAYLTAETVDELLAKSERAAAALKEEAKL